MSTKENQFICKPFSIIQDKRLTPLEQDYLCLIASLQNANGCTASNNYFANRFGVLRQHASRTISSLKLKGFITTTEEKRGGKTVKRTITITDEKSRKSLCLDSTKQVLRDSTKTGLRVSTKQAKGVSTKQGYHIIKNNNKTTNYIRPNSAEFRLAALLLNLILERKPDYKKPNLQQWAVHVDYMIRLDNRTPERIEAVIRWCQADSGNGNGWAGWQNNILSTEKLRLKFDQLELSMSKGNNHGQQNTKNNIRGFNYDRSENVETVNA